MSTPVATGTTVTYHGTYEQYHGPARVIDHTTKGGRYSRDGYRYKLVTETGDVIHIVRRQSFTVPITDQERTRRMILRADMDRRVRAPLPGDMPAVLGLDYAEYQALQFIARSL